jgi:predicted transcriptional regulator
MNELIRNLMGIGLEEKEARVYLALVSLGSASAYAIAEKAEMKKPTTYVILSELLQKGLVLKSLKSKRQLFSAKSPDELLAQAEEKLRAARASLPKIQALSKEQKIKTMYFEGMNAFKEVLMYKADAMSGKELIGFYAAPVKIPPGYLDLCWWWSKELHKKNVKVRGIAPLHPTASDFRATDIQYGREFKTIPFEEYSANISIDAGTDFVRIIDIEHLQAVILENPNITRTIKEIFEIVWKKTR